MKFGLYSAALSIFLLFLLLSSTPAAQHAANEPGLEERGMEKIASSGGSMRENMEGSDDMIRNLMGEEACDDGDEECLKRRLARICCGCFMIMQIMGYWWGGTGALPALVYSYGVLTGFIGLICVVNVKARGAESQKTKSISFFEAVRHS